jgi:hypothetical protein
MYAFMFFVRIFSSRIIATEQIQQMYRYKKTREKTLAFCTKIPHKKWTRDFFSSRALKTSKTPS